jgi:hypothetical protein
MEDSRSDLGSIEAAANDLGRLLLVEFATVYGNDWYVLPIKLAVGSLTILDSVIVSDVFGRNLLVERAGVNEPQWNLFSLDTKSSAHPAEDALFLPPTAGYTIESDAVESVLFLRDQVADLASPSKAASRMLWSIWLIAALRGWAAERSQPGVPPCPRIASKRLSRIIGFPLHPNSFQINSRFTFAWFPWKSTMAEHRGLSNRKDVCSL